MVSILKLIWEFFSLIFGIILLLFYYGRFGMEQRLRVVV